MKIKACKHCREEIAKNAKRCPKCGGKNGLSTGIKVLIVIAVIVLGIVSCVSSMSDAVDEVFGGYDDQNGKTSFNVGETFESKYLKILYVSSNSDYKNYNNYLGPNEGNKVVEFVFSAENIGEEEQNFSIYEFDCYADDIAKDQFYYSTGNENTYNTLSAGKKASLSVYCEVPKTASKVTVEFKPVLADENYEFIAK